MRREHLFFNSYIASVGGRKNSANLQILHKAKAKVNKKTNHPNTSISSYLSPIEEPKVLGIKQLVTT